MGIEEKGELLGEAIDIQPGIDGCLDVGDAIGQRKSDFLHGRAACFSDVIAGNRNRIPMRHFPAAKIKDIGDQAH